MLPGTGLSGFKKPFGKSLKPDGWPLSIPVMEYSMVLDDAHDVLEVAADAPTPRRRRSLRVIVRVVLHNIALAAEWMFGVISLILGLAILAALPVAQFLSMGYFLESSARVAQSGKLRDGIIGVRRAARVGGLIAGAWLSTVPLWLVGSYARTADLVDPGGKIAAGWRFFQLIIVVLTFLHIGLACMRGGRLRHFLIPFGNPFWLRRRLRQGGLYTEARDGLWNFLVSLHLPRYFRFGLIGFIGTLSWLIVPAVLISSGGKFPPLGVIGVILLAVIVPFLPLTRSDSSVVAVTSTLTSPLPQNASSAIFCASVPAGIVTVRLLQPEPPLSDDP
jgi:hypothetical protein